jgi:hypothetical protein
MLKGNTFTIHIHRREARAKQAPQAANCQLVSMLAQKALLHSKAGILMRANFRNTCPPQSRML